jgi:dATP pyrophosphohydrolase
MKKRKVQSIIFYCDANRIKHFLLLKMNERRNFHWQNITGGVDTGEEYIEAAKREAIEETNISDDNIAHIHKTNLIFEFHDSWGNDVIEKVFFIQCKNKFEAIIDPSEHSDFNWVSAKEINQSSVHFESNFIALKAALEFEC